MGERVSDLRKRRGMTQKALSDRLGITQTVVSKYERGDIRMSLSALVRICQILKVSSDEILGLKKMKGS